jgi:hypothetical protein
MKVDGYIASIMKVDGYIAELRSACYMVTSDPGERAGRRLLDFRPCRCYP